MRYKEKIIKRSFDTMKKEQNSTTNDTLATDLPPVAPESDKMATVQTPSTSLPVGPQPEAATPETPASPCPATEPPVTPDCGPTEGRSPQSSPASHPSDPSPCGAPAPDDWETKLAEAEQRGYLRGRNESIARLMEAPAMFERSTPAPDADAPADAAPGFLSRQRVSIWNR